MGDEKLSCDDLLISFISLISSQRLQKGAELPEIQMILRGDSPARDDPQEPDGKMTSNEKTQESRLI